jgi:hypothetical protein
VIDRSGRGYGAAVDGLLRTAATPLPAWDIGLGGPILAVLPACQLAVLIRGHLASLKITGSLHVGKFGRNARSDTTPLTRCGCSIVLQVDCVRCRRLVDTSSNVSYT